jgi:POT family proton-dependent oligopeptide transporter
MVADLYPEGGGRRDAGFTIFYMGINIGGFLGPIVTGWLAVHYGWRAAFAAGSVLMILGLVQYKLFQRHLGNAGLHVADAQSESSAGRQRSWMIVGALVAAMVAAYLLVLTGVVKIDPLTVAQTTGGVLFGIAVVYFAYIFAFAGLDSTERKRMAVILFLFIGCMLFWAGFEQTGASLNLFAERYVDRTVGWLNNWEIPTAWFQSFNSLFILIFAVPFSMLWVALARRNLDPSAPAKFALGLIMLGLGFLFMVWAANIVSDGGKAMPYLLILTYLLHTYGELCLSPVGLSYVTKLAPKRFVSQMMGVWFLATSLGNLSAGLLAGMFETDNVQAMPGQFMNFVWFICAAGIVLLLLSKPVKKLMVGVK